MIVLDTSAAVSVLRAEADSTSLREKLQTDQTAILSTATALELYIVMSKWGEPEDMWKSAENLFATYGISIVPFTERQLASARQAFLRYGKGRHPAALNFGDCFAYALAKTEGVPLLAKGTDFAKTDIEIA